MAEKGRYELGREIGRGGLGRVVEAEDTAVGRTVALKLLLEGAPLEIVQRFEREGRVTGRLEHPNIVPVHEVGVLPGGPGRPSEVFFAMKRISGRDMGEVIADLARGKPAGEWTQRRLVEALRDACRAVAYAHSKGVVHRDLKPSNIMLGEFGEVLVVDWGLAKEQGERAKGREGGGAAALSPSRPLALTLDGDVMGTPEYMPPEQAAGNFDQVDERSDVYALGAILYEILVWRPPYEGRTSAEVLTRVLSEPVRAPSTVAGGIPGVRPAPAAPRAKPPPVPAELESICMRALAREKRDRYAGAAELAGELNGWLEGSKERERRCAHADQQVRAAGDFLQRARDLEESAREALRRAVAVQQGVAYHEGPDRKRPIWKLEDEAAAARRSAIEAQANALAALSAALSVVPDHAEARRMTAELHWEKFVEAEKGRDEAGAITNRRLAETYNNGVLDARLRGEGSIRVTALRYSCACLAEGRTVRPDELAVCGIHPWSGRCVSDPGAEDVVAGAEPAEGIRLRVHSASCATVPHPGVEVWAFRYEEVDRRLVPVSPDTGDPPVPPAVLDRLFPDSWARPVGRGIYLGRTPVVSRSWAMGSWLFILVPRDAPPCRVPVLLGRQQDLHVEVVLYGESETPPGFLPVSGGAFASGADPKNPLARAGGTHRIGDFFLSRTPVTCTEYLAWLNELHKSDPAAAALHVPRNEAQPLWPLSGDSGYVVPTAEWAAKAAAAGIPAPPALDWSTEHWREDWPAVSLSWFDAVSYARWLSMRSGWLFTLPTGLQHEKATRGPDGRFFPWGNHLDPSFCNMNASNPTGSSPVAAGSVPADESPYGVRDLGGNVHTFCLTFGPSQGRRTRVSRGGAWIRTEWFCRASQTLSNRALTPLVANGVRLLAMVTTPVAEDAEDA